MKVSVVIPIARTASILWGQIQALVPQIISREDTELVLACNDPNLFESDELGNMMLAIKDLGVRVKLVDATAKRGPSYARNVGWENSSGDLVLFCDDDDVAGSGWVNSMVSGLEGSPVVGGRLDYSTLNPSHLADWQRNSMSELPIKFRHLRFTPSCNLGVTREVLAATHGFDESVDYCEDIDFCWRAQYLGFSIGFLPGAVMHYRLRSGYRAVWRQSYHYGFSDGKLMSRHKDFGAIRTIEDCIRDLLSIAFALSLSPFSKGQRTKLVQRAGSFAGRIVVSFKTRMFVV